MLFTINPNITRGGCIFKCKKDQEFYVKINETWDNRIFCGVFVRLNDNCEHAILESDMELWTILR